MSSESITSKPYSSSSFSSSSLSSQSTTSDQAGEVNRYVIELFLSSKIAPDIQHTAIKTLLTTNAQYLQEELHKAIKEQQVEAIKLFLECGVKATPEMLLEAIRLKCYKDDLIEK